MKFEDYLKENLNEQRTDTDSAKIWNSVSDRIDESKKRRRFLWIFGIVGIITLIFSIIGFSYLYKSNTTELSHPTLSKQQELESGKMNKDNHTNQPKSLHTTDNQTNTIASVQSEKTKQSINKANETAHINTTSDKKMRNISSKIGSESPYKKEAIDPQKENELRSRLDQIGDAINFDLSRKSNQGNIEKQDKLKLIALSPIRVNDTDLLTLPQKTLNLQNNIKALLPEQSITNIKTPKIFIGLHTSIGLSNKDINNDNSNSYTHLRKETEMALEHIETEVHLGYQISEKWSIISGINHLRQVEQFKWEGDYSTSSDGAYLYAIYLPNETDSIPTYMTGTHLKSVHRKMNIYNKSNILSIPLKISYTMGLGKNKLSITPGILYTAVIKTKGYMLSPDVTPINLSDIKNELDISYSLNVQFVKRIKGNTQLTIGSNYRYIPTWTQINDLNTSTLRYHMINLHLGIRHWL